ncbi:hypothetical protein C1N62_21945 (plasmid) [Nissabacter sp. SGAir0207]|nr:hypothetical protein C1N62_21945 [Nissabacter sp. SGAir0207]
MSPQEYFEGLEQLRVLWNGGTIRVTELSHLGHLTMHDSKDNETLARMLEVPESLLLATM